MDDQELLEVLQWKTGLKYLYFYSPREKVVRRLKPSEVFWPVVVLLSFYNKKHRFQTKQIANLSKVSAALVDVGHKVRWAWHFRKTRYTAENNYKYPGRRVVPFFDESGRRETCTPLERWLHQVKANVLAAC